MTVYFVGRAPSGDGPTIVVSEPSVSRNHCTVTLRGGRYVIEDLQSTSGTFIGDEQAWIQVERPTAVNLDTRLRLGAHETRVSTLLAHAIPPAQEKQQGRSVVYVRNPETGEIVKRYR